MKKGLAILNRKKRRLAVLEKKREQGSTFVREKRKREEKKRKERKKEGSSFVETVDPFLWVFYPLVISEVVYCSHDSDFSSEMKYILP